MRDILSYKIKGCNVSCPELPSEYSFPILMERKWKIDTDTYLYSLSTVHNGHSFKIEDLETYTPDLSKKEYAELLRSLADILEGKE